MRRTYDERKAALSMSTSKHPPSRTRSILRDWTGDADRFRSVHWQRSPVLLHPSRSALRHIHLEEVDSVLAEGLLHGSYVDLTHPERALPREAFCSPRLVNGRPVEGLVDGAKVRTLVRDGATLILRAVNHWHGGVSELTAGLGEELGRTVDAAFFVTAAGQRGLELHRDDADVFVLQVSGSKHWEVYEPPADGWWQPGPVRATGPALSVTVRPGDVLHVPRGAAHRTSAPEEPSAHLSVFVHEVNTHDLYASLQALLTDGMRLAPRPLGDAALRSTAAALLDQLTKRLTDASPDDVVAMARRTMLAKAPELHASPQLAELVRNETRAHEEG